VGAPTSRLSSTGQGPTSPVERESLASERWAIPTSSNSEDYDKMARGCVVGHLRTEYELGRLVVTTMN
jgi:hypothetical protein